jgi:Ni,Fe-hydrogenase III large subunit
MGMTLLDRIPHRSVAPAHRPWPRAEVGEDGWLKAIDLLGSDELTLLGLWGEAATVHMALLDAASEIAVISLDCASGKFPSVGVRHPPAQRLERTVCDLFALEAVGASDTRPWLDHGVWGVHAPLGARNGTREIGRYEFLPANGEALHQVAVGPVHAGIIEPGHFRFSVAGEDILGLEERLGYVHKGIERLACGRKPHELLKLANRISGDSAVAHSWATAQAVERALGVVPTARGVVLRAILAERERIANHLGDVGAICGDVGFAFAKVQCSRLREAWLRCQHDLFGHRLLMDCITPGGVATDLHAGEIGLLRANHRDMLQRWQNIAPILLDYPPLQDRLLNTGRLSAVAARSLGTSGFLARGSGLPLDVRHDSPYAPYDRHAVQPCLQHTGDVAARLQVRMGEIGASAALLDALLDDLPPGPVQEPWPQGMAAEGLGVVEGFRGEIITHVRLDDQGHVVRFFPRDPSWFAWPALEILVGGNIVADFPVCNKSVNASYSGCDL